MLVLQSRIHKNFNLFINFKISYSQLNNSRRVYRIEEKEEFERSYHSFVDVQAVRKMWKGVKYITKYLSKTKYAVKSQTLTLALCWLFRKQSFAISGDFKDLILRDTKKMIVQLALFGEELSIKLVWIFIGIFSAQKLGINRNEWRKVITDREILNAILS